MSNEKNFMNHPGHKKSYYWINAITLYRVVAAPCLLILLFTNHLVIFRWLLALSFFTDLVDGFLARKFRVASVFGTKMDSIGDDLTVLVALAALFYLYPNFVRSEKWIFIIALGFFLVQTLYSLSRYGKVSSFHTLLAKTAAILQGSFFILTFFIGHPVKPLFYAAAVITILELAEEIVLVYLLREWKTNVKGLYWVLKPGGKS